MKVGEIQEQENGSAIIELEMSREELDFFVSYAVNDILRKQLDKMESVGINEGDV
jgi:hypothetical protein